MFLLIICYKIRREYFQTYILRSDVDTEIIFLITVIIWIYPSMSTKNKLTRFAQYKKIYTKLTITCCSICIPVRCIITTHQNWTTKWNQIPISNYQFSTVIKTYKDKNKMMFNCWFHVQRSSTKNGQSPTHGYLNFRPLVKLNQNKMEQNGFHHIHINTNLRWSFY